MHLTRRCKHEFSSTIKTRGREYFRRGFVHLGSHSEIEAIGWSKGSGNKTYQLETDFRLTDDGILLAECTCPYFMGSGSCKHLWAFLIMLDEQGVSKRIRGRSDLEIHPLLDDSPLSDVKSLAELTTEEDPLRFEWRQQLAAVRSLVPIAPHPDRKFSQLWLGLDEGTCFRDGGIRIDFYCREPLKSGELGKLRSAGLGYSDLDRFEGEDRELLSFLFGLGLSEARENQSYRYDYRDPWKDKKNHLWVFPLLFDELLPRLCDSQKFGRLVEKKTELHLLRYDPEPLRLMLEARDHEGFLKIEGGFVKPDQEAPFQSVSEMDIHVLAGGWLLLFPDRFVRYENSEWVYPWIHVLITEGPIRILPQDEAAALEALWQYPNLPELTLPERLRVTEITEPPTPRLTFRSESAQAHLVGDVAFLYGDRAISIEDPTLRLLEGERVRLRDRASELRRLDELEALGVDLHMAFGAQAAIPPERFAATMGSLQESGWSIEVGGRTVRRSDGFSASVSSGIDWFEVSGAMDFGDLHAELPTLLAAARRQSRFVQLGDGSVGLLPEDWLRRLSPMAEMIGSSEAAEQGVRFKRHQALLLDALLATSEQTVDFDETFGRLRERLRSFGGLEPVSAPETFQGELRPYQEHGLAWMHWLVDLGLGGCLADDMGLGKTIQVLAFLEQRRLAGELDTRWSLLVVPRSLLRNWVSEGQRFTPDLPMHIHHGPGRGEVLKQLLEQGRPHVLVTTYGTLLRDIVTFQEIELDVTVLDEAQAIKNAKSQTAKACRLIEARHRLALTGTPVENHLGELWSLFEFLNPGMLGHLPALSGLAGKLKLSEQSLEVVARAIRPLVLRRTKGQVLKDLPAKTEQTLACELSTRERKRYDDLLRHYRSRLGQKVSSVGLGRSKMHVLEALLRLRQASCHGGLMDSSLKAESSAKLDVLLDRLREVVKEGDKALVFSQFTTFLAIVRDRLDKEGLVYEYLDGRTRKREDKVERFQTDPDCPIFLISLKAGGVGLNLTAASYIFLLDPWWNPAVESQAIDRAHRIGQEKPVFAYRLIARDTVEEKILEMQESKRALADAIVAQDRRVLSGMTAEDLELLLGGPLDGV